MNQEEQRFLIASLNWFMLIVCAVALIGYVTYLIVTGRERKRMRKIIEDIQARHRNSDGES